MLSSSTKNCKKESSTFAYFLKILVSNLFFFKWYDMQTTVFISINVYSFLRNVLFLNQCACPKWTGKLFNTTVTKFCLGLLQCWFWHQDIRDWTFEKYRITLGSWENKKGIGKTLLSLEEEKENCFSKQTYKKNNYLVTSSTVYHSVWYFRDFYYLLAK